ncbi:MAG: Rrf2 family protein [Pseudoalteromonas tetraodonis]|jgi:Rrf2 family protein
MRSVLAIARVGGTKPVQIQELSRIEDIPVKFLEQILLIMKRAGLLRSKRGIGGGYQLDRTPENITLGEIVNLIDGPFAPLSITPPDTDKTPPGLRPEDQGLHQCFTELQKLVNQQLDSHTLKDILEKERPSSVLAFDI